MRLRLALLLAFTVDACGSVGEQGLDGGGGASAGGGGAGANGGAGTSGSAAANGGAGTSGSAGVSGDPCQAVVALDRSCTASTDCFGGPHAVDSCGQLHVIGFRTSEKTKFDALEPACRALIEKGGCAGQQPYADDGSVLRFNEDPGVACVHGTCTTYLSDCGGPCPTGTACFSCANHASLYAACTTTCGSGVPCPDPALPLCQLGTSGNIAANFCTAANVACNTR
jgi:hypothetical protein